MPIFSRLILSFLLIGSSDLIAEIVYSLTDLGTLGDLGILRGSTVPASINNAGQVTGQSITYVGAPTSDGLAHGFLYSNGQMLDLGTLGGSTSGGMGINNLGQVVGSASTSPSGQAHAFLYTNGLMTDLNNSVDPRLNITLIEASDINDAGQIIGSSNAGLFIYSNGQITILETPGPSFAGVAGAKGINNAGQVTGFWSKGRLVSGAFLYSDGQAIDLGTLGGNSSFGAGINDLGQVVGYSDPAVGVSHAFLYSNGQMADLGSLPGYHTSFGLGINNAGEVVGFATNGISFDSRAFLFSNGQMLDLNNLIDPALHVTLNGARGINDHGQIVADGAGHGYLLTPVSSTVPEPNTLAFFGLGLLGLALTGDRMVRK